MIDLYELVARPRGLRPEQLPLAERRALVARALPVMWPGFGIAPNSDRGVEPIELAAYDPIWPRRFEQWSESLLAALPERPSLIAHVGSTAVPGLPAKPVIDILVSVADPDEEAGYVPAIEDLGVQLRSRDDQRRFFRPFAGRPRDVQIHVARSGGDWERRHLLFRDYLRAHPRAAAEYLEAKRAAAATWADDRYAYTDAKGVTIRKLMAEAERWDPTTTWGG